MLTKAELEAKKLKDRADTIEHITLVIAIPVVIGLLAISFMKLFIW